MALRRDSFFKLSRGERRAALWLTGMLAVLAVARMAKSYLFLHKVPDTPVQVEAFRNDLNVLDSLHQSQVDATDAPVTTDPKPGPPKKLDAVPREE
ncbi:hypothetical protein [uncultured Barnesiella sp.]|uniref:hypothetical protein n=1 Tax=uncultured Barnesiella sp. TaxID=584861 RepID=UPI001F91C8F5|nr:hypothetical protein [uncultured Barnesiella sp.]HJB72884.1 hypothetical protein [Candidatus Barnesiella merdigallinarum]